MPGPLIVTDMDGTLSAADTWRGVLAWIRANHDSPAARRFVQVRLPRVALAKAGLIDKEAFRARWLDDQATLLKGLPAEELETMGRWVANEHLWPARRGSAISALQAAAMEARAVDPSTRIILATGAYQPVGDAFAALIGADLALGTPLEVLDGIATGVLAAPTQSGEQKAAAVRSIAAGGEVIAAFGDTGADIPLLELARRPVAVAPDRELRRVALARGWSIVDAD